MWITRLCLVIILNVVLISAKKYDRRCKLVRDLIRSGMPNDIFLGQWVCLIEKVSKRDTAAFTVTPSGKKAYGLYQIPSRWCRERKKGGDCNIACESLLDDDIRDDTICAEMIFQREGFKYWSLWTTRCKDDRMIVTEIYKIMQNHVPGNEVGKQLLINCGNVERCFAYNVIDSRGVQTWLQEAPFQKKLNIVTFSAIEECLARDIFEMLQRRKCFEKLQNIIKSTIKSSLTNV